MKIIRDLYCESCFKAKRPQKDNIFAKEKDGDISFGIIKETDHHNFGITPHFIELISSIRGTITFQCVCAIDGCGIALIRDEDDIPQLFDEHSNPVEKDKSGVYWHLIDDKLMPYKGSLMYLFQILVEPRQITTTLRNWNALIQ